MAREGLSALLGAGALLCALCPPFTPPAAASEGAVTTALAVQTALQQGREQISRGNYQAAVFALESQLSRIDGSRDYLAALRDAYRGYVKELRQAGQDAEAQLYLRRLLTLDPGAILDFPPRGSGIPPLAVSAALNVDPQLLVPNPTTPGTSIQLAFPNTGLGNQLNQVAAGQAIAAFKVRGDQHVDAVGDAGDRGEHLVDGCFLSIGVAERIRHAAARGGDRRESEFGNRARRSGIPRIRQTSWS